MKDFNGEEAERLLLHLYTALPLLPEAKDGAPSAVLARFGSYEVRLTEFPPDCMPSLPLWVAAPWAAAPPQASRRASQASWSRRKATAPRPARACA
jgi:hypothetical protein